MVCIIAQEQQEQNGKSKPRADEPCSFCSRRPRARRYLCGRHDFASTLTPKLRAATIGSADPTLPDAVRTITREEGPLALYKGAVPALMLCGQGAVQFSVYEWLKARVPKRDENVS